MNNRTRWLFKKTVAILGLIVAGQAHAALVAYQDVKFVQGTGYFNDAFTINAPGSYKATLTDFNFPSLFGELSLDVTTPTETLGSLTSPGTFVFDALPGTYYANLYGVAGGALDLGLFGLQIESISASPAPVPAAIVLLASGLCVLVQMAWRRRGRSDDDGLVTKSSYSSVTV